MDKTAAGSPTGRGRGGQPQPDQLDFRILDRLLTDGRVRLREIAREMDVSPTTVTARVERLRKGGVIRGYSAIVDYARLGYEITAVTEILVSKGKLLEMEKEIARLPGVCAVYDVTGEIDGIVIAKFRSNEDLSRFTKGLLTMPFVERAITHVVLTVVKEDFRVRG